MQYFCHILIAWSTAMVLRGKMTKSFCPKICGSDCIKQCLQYKCNNENDRGSFNNILGSVTVVQCCDLDNYCRYILLHVLFWVLFFLTSFVEWVLVKMLSKNYSEAICFLILHNMFHKRRGSFYEKCKLVKCGLFGYKLLYMHWFWLDLTVK